MPVEWKTLLGEARHSYGGAYDFEKHLDDKVGRFLTAIAFFVSGGLVIAFRGDLMGARYVFPDRNGVVALPVISLGIFLALTAITVFFLLASLGPNFVFRRRPPPSLIFTQEIATLGEDDWLSEWNQYLATDGSDFYERLGTQVIRDTRQIALNTEHKNNRLSEARVIFTLALLAFTFAVVFATHATATVEHHAAATQSGANIALVAIQWSDLCRALSAGVMLTFVAIVGYDAWRLAKLHETNEEHDYGLKPSHVLLFTLAGLAFSLGTTFFVVPGWERVCGAVIVGVSGIVALATVATIRTADWAVGVFFLIVAACVGAIVLLFASAEPWLLLIAASPIALLQTPRLSNSRV